MTTKGFIQTQIKKIAKLENKNLDYDTIEDIKITTSKFIVQSKKVRSTRKNQTLHRKLRRISHNTSIKCLKMNKGNVVVVLNRTDQINKMNKILEPNQTLI